MLNNLLAAEDWMEYRKVLNKRGRSKDGLRVAFLSPYTINPLADCLEVQAAMEGINITTYHSEYSIIMQELLDEESGLYKFNPEFIIFCPALTHTVSPIQSMMEMVKRKCDAVCLVTSVLPDEQWPFTNLSVITARTFNESLRTYPWYIDTQELVDYYGHVNCISPDLYHKALIPFTTEFLVTISKKILTRIKAIQGLSKKCLVLDCDYTLWGGIVGEVGAEKVMCTLDDMGTEYREFQDAVKTLYERGVILALCSKNNMADVKEVFEKKDTTLKWEHFAAVQINWENKATNISRIAEELKIGLDSMVFIDDSIFERDMMRKTRPEVAVMDFPDNPAYLAQFLRDSTYFDWWALTDTDKNRGKSYAANRQRAELEEDCMDFDEYIKSLKMRVEIKPAEDFERVVQLCNRSNQFNLTTTRYTMETLPIHLDMVYTVHLSDKFNDEGIVGVLILKQRGDGLEVDTFLLSCRAIGRKIEDVMMSFIYRLAAAKKIRIIVASYYPTSKNAMVKDFWSKSYFSKRVTEVDGTVRYVCNVGMLNYAKINWARVKFCYG